MRDGKECQVEKEFPFIPVTHTKVFQVDHCITRVNKYFFVDHRNGTVVCSACNMLKNMNMKSIDRAIDYIVKKREGTMFFDAMVNMDMAMEPNTNWGNISWLEEQIEKLKEEKEKYL